MRHRTEHQICTRDARGRRRLARTHHIGHGDARRPRRDHQVHAGTRRNTRTCARCFADNTAGRHGSARLLGHRTERKSCPRDGTARGGLRCADDVRHRNRCRTGAGTPSIRIHEHSKVPASRDVDRSYEELREAIPIQIHCGQSKGLLAQGQDGIGERAIAVAEQHFREITRVANRHIEVAVLVEIRQCD